MEEKLIDCKLYGGKSLFSSKRNPYELRKIYCTNCENCPLYKNRKECLHADKGTFVKCPYGRVETSKGPTARAKSYNELRLKYDEMPNNLKSALDACSAMFGLIGDYFFVNPAYADIKYNEEENKLHMAKPELNFYREIFVYKKELLTEEFLNELFSYQPRTIFEYSIIKEYQDKIVPAIKSDLVSAMPELAKKLGIESVSHVGMLAKLKSLKPNIEVNLNGIKDNGAVFKGFYDGKYITVQAKNVVDRTFRSKFYSIFIGEPIGDVKFVPDDELYVEVLDDAWTLPDTVYKRKD